ncbi:polyphosphate kinase 2 [Breoghania corrubedonensis]|uniref:ADP/GDP-polyphosphate phosphotransferase n=1 Tax=Breoghania corrubedonensis TaxID=665038 RepID=A0A2T5VEH5_9HYPH|nr:polyphosphate kinase 2 [Breoghania corrubedonensis]PTW62154.1 polyphosphate kinase 2 [Breoghania corrubedonensis]
MSEFDLENPVLPRAIRRASLPSGDYPYSSRMKRKPYEKKLRDLQIELVKAQRSVREKGQRIVVIFEGRDAAGKGGTIFNFRQNMNPRYARVVALSKPSSTEAGQWYFQRYVTQLPTAGEIVLFDRSWYNRAVVERVNGFCTREESEEFLDEVPRFEQMLVDGGLTLFKIWLNIGREMQMKRFHDRRHDPLKIWKLSPIDVAALAKWDDYTAARDRMFARSHTAGTPWTIVRSNDKRRARLNAMRHVLSHIDYEDKDWDAIGAIDPLILGSSPDILSGENE